MQKAGGYLVISLDFELHWGMFDTVSISDYGEHYVGVTKAVPEMLALFSEHSIHATWATVGMLMCADKTELLELAPRESRRPRYRDETLSAYRYLESNPIGENERVDHHHFAPSLVREIIETPHQELASHTFSHFYCQAKQENPVAFAADCEAQRAVFAGYEQSPQTLIFPRNQVSSTALTAAATAGVTAYRGTEDNWLYRSGTEQPLFKRALRLMDAYINLSGHHTTALERVEQRPVSNIPASRFLRPYSKKLRWLEARKLRRITDSMTHAAKHNEIFHLWWHPHNFGTNRPENLQQLQTILQHFESLQTEYGMQSQTMNEIATVMRGASHLATNELG
ncbi:polysaccharide deacetylase family protein [Candidatus Pacebacteria bacterium]|nr:polysaccharide deacetylase family protein [Candidatus Paceibacterota bacterium]